MNRRSIRHGDYSIDVWLEHGTIVVDPFPTGDADHIELTRTEALDLAEMLISAANADMREDA